MKKDYSRLTTPYRNEVTLAVQTMPRAQWRLLIIFALILTVGSAILLYQLNQGLLTEVPASGGSLAEGVIGAPRFINPVLATSDADRDLTTLIYSGLMRVGKDGNLEPDLAASYEVSPDQLIYSFTLKEDLRWHDGEPLSSADIAFTIATIQNPETKSNRWASWEGVSIEMPNPKQVIFKLKQPFPGFLEHTTIGILPEHLWGELEPGALAFSNLNIEAVGSGPYQIADISFRRGDLKLPEFYDLKPFPHFALGAPKISHLRLKFYPSEEALLAAYEKREIESVSGLAPELMKELSERQKDKKILTTPLPRIFGIFFNQNQAPIFAQQEVREALDQALDRESIINQVLAGYGQALNAPLLPAEAGRKPATSSARELLEAKDQDPETLSFTLTTSEVPELKAVAELVRQQWEEALGIKVELKVFEVGDLNQNIIRPRQYEALLFGEVLGRQPDPFAFWHSSQRLDPGANIALYTNIKVDRLLEDLRQVLDPTERRKIYAELNAEINRDTPAIFLYQPDFIYLLPEWIKEVSLPILNQPAERFATIHEWYIATDKVWNIFN